MTTYAIRYYAGLSEPGFAFHTLHLIGGEYDTEAEAEAAAKKMRAEDPKGRYTPEIVGGKKRRARKAKKRAVPKWKKAPTGWMLTTPDAIVVVYKIRRVVERIGRLKTERPYTVAIKTARGQLGSWRNLDVYFNKAAEAKKYAAEQVGLT